MEIKLSVKPFLRDFPPQWEHEIRSDAKRRQTIEKLAVCFLSHQTFSPVMCVPVSVGVH